MNNIFAKIIPGAKKATSKMTKASKKCKIFVNIKPKNFKLVGYFQIKFFPVSKQSYASKIMEGFFFSCVFF